MPSPRPFPDRASRATITDMSAVTFEVDGDTLTLALAGGTYEVFDAAGHRLLRQTRVLPLSWRMRVSDPERRSALAAEFRCWVEHNVPVQLVFGVLEGRVVRREIHAGGTHYLADFD